jgi:hypothetical protein
MVVDYIMGPRDSSYSVSHEADVSASLHQTLLPLPTAVQSPSFGSTAGNQASESVSTEHGHPMA